MSAKPGEGQPRRQASREAPGEPSGGEGEARGRKPGRSGDHIKIIRAGEDNSSPDSRSTAAGTRTT